MKPSIRILSMLAAMAVFARFSAAQSPPPASETTAKTVPRTDANSRLAHTQLLEKARQGGIDIYFEGDSITRRWGTSDARYKDNLANWNKNFFGWNAADFGWGADRIENILWRLDNGELDGVNPKIIVLLAGANNVGTQPGNAAKIKDIIRGIKAVVATCQEKAPAATIILTGIFPRNDNLAVMPTINKINDCLARMADGKKVRYLNVNGRLARKDGKLFHGMMDPGDKLHPTVKGYQVWADGLKPIFTELLGPPAKSDHAPPPTGDPSAAPASPSSRIESPHKALIAQNIISSGFTGDTPRRVHKPWIAVWETGHRTVRSRLSGLSDQTPDPFRPRRCRQSPR